MSLDQRPVTTLAGVGPALAEKLARLGITSVQDLLFHLPSRYEDRTRVLPIGSLRPGARAQIEAEVQLAEVVYRRRRSLLVRVADGSGSMTLRFFHFSGAQQRNLARGARIRCFGEARRGPGGLEMVHPEYRLLAGEGAAPVADTLTPSYPVTDGVQQGRIRRLVDLALADMSDQGPEELLPARVLDRSELPSLQEALRTVHHPPPEVAVADLLEG